MKLIFPKYLNKLPCFNHLKLFFFSTCTFSLLVLQLSSKKWFQKLMATDSCSQGPSYELSTTSLPGTDVWGNAWILVTADLFLIQACRIVLNVITLRGALYSEESIYSWKLGTPLELLWMMIDTATSFFFLYSIEAIKHCVTPRLQIYWKYYKEMS